MAKKESGESVALGCLLLVISVPAGTIWGAFALKVCWGWFLVPLGFPVIGMAHTVGVTIVVRMLCGRGISRSDPDKTTLHRAVEALTLDALVPAFAVGYGYLVTLFM